MLAYPPVKLRKSV